MRFLAAFGLAILVVLAMLLIGLRLSGFTERNAARGLNLHEVDVLSETQRRNLIEVLGENEGRSPTSFPQITDIPPLRVGEQNAVSEPEPEGIDR